MRDYILAIDQGTTSSRAMLFNRQGETVSVAQETFTQYFPDDGWVEHDPEDIWQTVVRVCRQAMAKASVSAEHIAGLGITNQRETSVLWRRSDGEPLGRAIVWQDRRTAPQCEQLRQQGHEAEVQQRTGLLLDPYFSATKLAWMLDHYPDARAAAERGELAFGTIECFLLWRLTGGQVHATDVTNASRTQLCNLHTLQWDEDLLALFKIPASVLPEIRDNVSAFGQTQVFGHAIPIVAMAGDQQAASIGQACLTPGMAKSTYGTGAFLVMNTGERVKISQHRLLSTVAYRVGEQCHYALEGSIFVAGAAVQWLRDGLGLIASSAETEALAQSVSDSGGVYVVPALTGLGAPHWQPYARGAIYGLTRDTQGAHIVRATLESIAYQTRDVFTAMQKDGADLTQVRVDGGMVTNDWFCQCLANTLNTPIQRPQQVETTVLGVAYLTALGSGWYASLQDVVALWQQEACFEPQTASHECQALYEGWLACVKASCLV